MIHHGQNLGLILCGIKAKKEDRDEIRTSSTRMDQSQSLINHERRFVSRAFLSTRVPARLLARQSESHRRIEKAAPIRTPQNQLTTTTKTATMVRVWYEPPPSGPRSHLNRGSTYIETKAMFPFLKRMSKARPLYVITGSFSIIACLCYIPLSKYHFQSENLRKTMEGNPMHRSLSHGCCFVLPLFL